MAVRVAARRRAGPAGGIDLPLLAVVLALLVLGIDMVYSASFVLAHNSTLYDSDSYFMVRQVMFAVIGAVAMLLVARSDYHVMQRYSVLLLAVSVVMLFAVLVPGIGHVEYGAQRWLKLGPLPPIQPSELAKLAVVVYFADWLSRKGENVRDLTYGSLPFAIILVVIVALVMLQPDLGTSTVIVASAVAVFFVGGAHLAHFSGGLALGGAALAMLIRVSGYRWSRFIAFLNPQDDPTGAGWHTIQTSIALGSGGLFGLGLGESRQKFYWVPGAHTDAIYSIIGEELGFIGCLAVLALFGVLAQRGFSIARRAPDQFGALLAVGSTCLLVFQAAINIGVVAAVLPFTGITLPFISSGGSSLVVSMVAVGCLLSVSRQASAPAAAR
ncbi:MAG: putative lipid II flippase FtsW [Chloroflexi bacterium]|nr:putative lipid II flippase FtsW [Chloroflexota bacterium]MCL5110198.1 putative lipid II flippase FtsW [Chloroflexota bacterium]